MTLVNLIIPVNLNSFIMIILMKLSQLSGESCDCGEYGDFSQFGALLNVLFRVNMMIMTILVIFGNLFIL